MSSDLNNAIIRSFTESPEVSDPAITNGPLAGLTYGIKDIALIEGQPLTFGLKPPLVERAPFNAEIIDTLGDLGATLKVICNMDPAAISASGKNPFYGDMQHPFSSESALGGSSGGCAIVVANDTVDFAVGSDHGGSLRIPAATCGLFGLVLPPATLPEAGCMLLPDPIDRLGFLVKDFERLKRICSAIPGQNKNAPQNKPIAFYPNKAELNVCSPVVRDAFTNALRSMQGVLDHTEYQENLGFEMALTARKKIVARRLMEFFETHEYNLSLLPDDVRAVVIYGGRISKEEFSESVALADELKARMTRIMQDGAVVITPILPDTPDRFGQTATAVNYFLSLANICGCTALSCPLPDLPVQIVASAGKVTELLQTASLLLNAAKNG